MKKRILSIFLAVCLIFTLLPVGALAEETTVTRAEWIQSLVKIFDMTVEEGAPPENYYSDLTGDETYYRDILVAAEFGVIDTPAGEAFEPNEPATREFAAQTLNFCLGFQLGEDKQYTYAEYETVEYPDDIQVAVNRSWFALENGNFLPQQAVTVAESEAMLKDAATILSGNTVNENYDSTYTFEKDVIVIPEGTTVGVSEDTVTITDSTKTIAAGQMFAVYVNGIPQAFVANSVSVSGNITTVQGTPTDDAFAAIDAQGVVTAELDQVEALEGTDLSYYVEETERAYETYDMAKAAQRRAIGGTIKPKNISLSFKHDVTISSSIKGTISGKIKNPVIKYNINLAKGKALVSLAYDVDVTYTLKGEVSGVKSLNDIKLFYWGVPGVGGFSVTFDMDLSGSIKSVQSSHEERGLSVSVKDGVQMTKSFEAKSFSIEIEATARAGIQAKAGITELPVFNVYIYGKVGMEAKLKSATYSDSASPKRCTHFAAYLYAECGATGSVKLLSFKNSFDLKYTIFSEKNSPIRICHHYEDGKLVSDCTRGNVSAWFDGNGFSGYHTPSDSSYMSSGWSGGSGSVGYDRNGKPKTLYTYTLDDYKNATITEYNGNARSLSVPQTIDGYTIVGIGSSAFEGNTNLRFLSLPDTVTKIGSNAFSDCTSLSKVTLPDSLTTIENCAFNNCESLEEVRLPDGLTEIEFRAFGACTSLKKVYIPKTITSCAGYNPSSCVYEGPFRGCTSLNDVEFADGIKTIPQNLFLKCTGLREIALPDTVTTIGSAAFEYCSNLTSIVWSNNLTTIGDSAFYACTKLAEVALPDTVTKIGSNAFSDCTSLSKVTLPDSLNTMGDEAFCNCFSLKELKLSNSMSTIPGNAFTGCSVLEELVIPDSVAIIEEEAFMNCSALKMVSFGKGLTAIYNNAFNTCDALDAVVLPESLKTIYYNAFRDCDALTEITIPNNVTSIGNSAFYDCDSLAKVTISNSVTSMGTYVFYDCDALTDVQLGTGITTIPDNTFNHCDALASIVIPRRVTTIGNYAFKDCVKFTEITIPRAVTSISANAFSYPAKMTIYGVAGTYAETFANDNSIKFVDRQINATSATLDKTMLTLNKGSNTKLYLSVQPTDFTDEVNWKSANTSVVTVAADGTVKAVGVGTTTIKVTVGNASASCKVTVVQPVTSISLNKASLSMEALSTYQLTATAYPNDAYDKSVRWESSDNSVATVSDDGLVTAVGKGTATIKATSTAVSSVSRSCTVTVTNNGIVAKDVAQLESPHNYRNNCSDIWLYTLPGASKITATFDERTNIEDGFDYLYIYNAKGEQVGKYTGTELAGKSIDIDGDTVKIKLVSDGGGNEWGFKVTDVKVASGAHVHSYTSIVTAPTCTEKGYTTHTCACGDSYVDSYTDALGHSYGTWKQTKAPTCTEKGMETRTCTRCNASETRDVAALGHAIVHHAAKAATCTEKGWAAYDTCSRCDYSTYKEIAATGHHHNAVVTAPTCTAKGYTTHTCNTCGNSYKDSYTNALGHSYKNGKCTRCGAADPNYKPEPKAPELKITTVSGKPKISWNAVDGAVKYWVYRSTDGKNFKYYDRTNNTSYTNKSTEIGTTYYYKVKAVNANNAASDYSVSKGIQCKPAAPTVSIYRTNGKPKLSWKAVSGAKKYWIYRSTDGKNFKYWDSTTKLSYTNSGAASGTKYYYRVKAVAVVNGKNVISANSSTKSLMTTLAKPSVSITTSNGKPKLTWKAVTGADKYYIYRSTDGKTFSYWDSTTKTSYVNSGAKKNTKYYYKVKAVCASNSNANSAQSSTVSIKATK